ncbi:MAG: VWA domain-containing protein [Deltaproteobacteria bacterium]|nr:VWA domain-containing protein [Deltaproteobacteria bacterium]
MSPPELCDSARALDLVDMSVREDVRRALAATLCKRGRDRATFDSVFDANFPASDPFSGELPEPGGVGDLGDAELVVADAIASGRAARLSALARYALTGEGIDLLLELLESGVAAGTGSVANVASEEFLSARLLDAVAWEASEDEIRRFLDALSARLGPEGVRLLSEAAARRRREVRAAVGEIARRTAARSGGGRAPVSSKVPLEEKSFYLLTEADTGALRGVVSELARKIRARARKKKKRFSRGKLDVKRMMRLNVGTGGIPMRAAFRKRRPRRTTLLVLCDLSDSVRNVSRFMLEFTFTLQDLFGPVRSLAFVNEVGEATGLFARYDVGEAVGRVLAGEAVNVWGNSNYGRVFDAVLSAFPTALTRDTVLVIIGDGRNNFHYANEEALREIRRRSKRVIWLTPEPQSSWGFGDSEMWRYRRHCDRVETVRNFGDLKAFVDTLTL